MSPSDSRIARLMPSYVIWTVVARAAHVAATVLLFAGMTHAQTTARAPVVSALEFITAPKA